MVVSVGSGPTLPDPAALSMIFYRWSHFSSFPSFIVMRFSFQDKSVIRVEFQKCVFEGNPQRRDTFQENSSCTFPIKKLISQAKIVSEKIKSALN